MKYCSKCGQELVDEAVICTNCGCKVASTTTAKVDSGLKTACKILMILSTVALAWGIIPLAWCIPMTISYCRKIKNNEEVSMGFKICTLLFVNVVAGILMLCDNDIQ